jgi:DNA polymerase-3 subunit delta
VTDEKPVVYILHGEDVFAIQKFVSGMIAKLGDPSLADLNLARLDGKVASDNDLRTAVLSMPFLTERRLVVLTNPLAKLTAKSRAKEDADEDSAASTDEQTAQEPGAAKPSTVVKAKQERFLALLTSIPATTALALVVDDYQVRRKGQWEWEFLTPNHWLSKWANRVGGRAMVREFFLPRAEEMPGWIRKQVQAQGGQINKQAAQALSEHLGSDTLAVAQEITKLLTYVNTKRPIEVEDVELLTARLGLADIFKMVDSMTERKPQQTLKELHLLLENSEPQEVFGMIVRQFRLLLQAREVLDEGGNVAQIQAEVIDQKNKIHPYVAGKLVTQAARFNLEALTVIYHRLLAMDLAIKTSQMPFELAMDTLVAELTQP